MRSSANMQTLLTSRTNNSTNQMEQLIEDLKNTACSIESNKKQHKTMETLNAISGMLESLKNNHILSPIEEVQHKTSTHRRDKSFETGRQG